jgi:cellulose synthase/poly-beta-1,6-N-acetylglucosamine synthase-like glycosyltransferase
MILIYKFIFFGSLFGIFCVFFGYPLILYVSVILKNKNSSTTIQEQKYPYVSFVVVFRNAESLIENKIHNFMNLDYPNNRRELILVSDGTDDGSSELVHPYLTNNIHLFQFSNHKGKAQRLNFGVEKSRGEFVFFSDADSILDNKSISLLINHFYDSEVVGGVCGQRVIVDDIAQIKTGQMEFVKWDLLIKLLETRNGFNITSNEGKIYVIRKKLYCEVPDGVTDDAYVLFSIVSNGYRFVFEQEAKSFIMAPSRNARHELIRRIRIVSTSLNGLKMNRKLFNPFKYGVFSYGLFINKVLRRLLPVFFIFFFISSFLLYVSDLFYATIAILFQIVGYIFSFSYPYLNNKSFLKKYKIYHFVSKLSELGFYFCLGLLGTFLGVLFFCVGKKITKWEPLKN